ncbi:MAG: DUF6568 family protein [Bacilli bacterium]
MEKRKIEKKNYFILAVILVVTIFLLFYSRSWYRAYKEHQLSTPIIDGYLNEVTFEELPTYISDNKDAVIYVTKSDIEDIREFEVDFKPTVEEYNLKDIMVYLNLYDREDYEKDVKDLFNIDDVNEVVPVVVVYKEGEVSDYISWSPLEKLTSDKVISLLEENQMIEE